MENREKEIEFAKTLEKLRRTAGEQNQVLSESQVREAFAAQGLSEEQLTLVFDYLKEHRIGIGEPVDTDETLSREDTDYLKVYLQELEALEQLSEGEQEAVTLSAMAGDAQAAGRLIRHYLPRVVEIARLYAGQGVFLEDLIGEGNVALTLGAQMLGCLDKGEEAQGMLGRMIMDAMEDLIARTLQDSQADRQVLSRVNEVNDKARELAESLSRKVSVAELARETGMEPEEIREALRMSASAIAYLEQETDRQDTEEE